MSKYLLNESTIQDIADAIRSKNGQSTEYLPSDMPAAITGISNVDFYSPLCFTSDQTNSTVYITTPVSLNINLMKSTDGEHWSSWEKDSNGTFSTITLNSGDKLYIRGDNSTMATMYVYSNFKMTGRILASGSLGSLLDATGKILSLYRKEWCFYNLFLNCTALITPPDFPFLTVAKHCCHSLFKGCTGLKKPMLLPSNTVDIGCYRDMFNGCSSLEYAPELPATILKEYCYQNMFIGCTSLKTAPKLPAPTLITSCYYNMFQNCSNLSNVIVGATSWDTSNASDWLKNVSSSGIFTKPSGTTIPTGANGIPSGWTVVNV